MVAVNVVTQISTDPFRAVCQLVHGLDKILQLRSLRQRREAFQQPHRTVEGRDQQAPQICSPSGPQDRVVTVEPHQHTGRGTDSHQVGGSGQQGLGARLETDR